MARPEEVPYSVRPRLAVHVLVIVVMDVEWHERRALGLGPLTEEVVEHLLPRRRVHCGGLGQDTVEVEQAGVNAVGETEHRRVY